MRLSEHQHILWWLMSYYQTQFGLLYPSGTVTIAVPFGEKYKQPAPAEPETHIAPAVSGLGVEPKVLIFIVELEPDMVRLFTNVWHC